MKTRRSIRLQKTSNICMQTVLFPEERSRSSIVPETPENYNVPCNSTVMATASVLETPEENATVQKINLKEGALQPVAIKPNQINLHTSNETEFDDSMAYDITPDLNLHKRKGIISILESEYSFTKTLMTKATTSSMLYVADKKQRKSNSTRIKKSLADIILPFDLHDNNKLAKKLSTLQESTSHRKSLSLNSSKKGSKSPISKNNSKRKSLLSYAKRKSTSRSSSLAVNMSIENSSVKETTSNGFSNNSHRNVKKSTNSDTTRNSFDDSNLDLTDANFGNIFVESEKTSTSRPVDKIPPFNLSSSDSELDKSSYNSHGKKNLSESPQNNHLSFRNFSSLSFKEYEKRQLNKENNIYTDNTPISNYNRVLQGELSPINRSVFQSQESLQPTQPASILVLQGVIAFVDVRSGAENRSEAFKEVLLSLGAEVVDKLTTEITHVVFRDGSKSTYQRSIQRGLHLVSPLWVDACRVELVRVSESLFPISSEYTKNTLLALGKPNIPRKLKSMQPREWDEEMLMAEARLQKRKKLQARSNTSSTSEEVITPRRILQSSTEDLNSPLFGIQHLLTPTRSTRESASSISSEKSSGEKEFLTPLATRMYNKLVSPKPSSPLKKIPLPFSPLVRENSGATTDDEDRGLNVQRIHPSLSKGVEEAGSSSSKGGLSSRNRIGNNEELNSEYRDPAEMVDPARSCLPLNSNNEQPTSVPREVEPNKIELGVTDSPALRVDSKSRKSILKSGKSVVTRRSARLSVSYKENDNSGSSSSESLRHGRNKLKPQSGAKETQSMKALSSSLPSGSQGPSSSGVRRRRLHTVDVIDPNQDLIIPSTPPVTEQIRSGPYNEIRSHPIPQRKELNRIAKKLNAGEVNAMPLPRTLGRKRRPAGRDRFPSTSSSSLTAISEKTATPKRRVSLVPRQRTSLEEFQTPRRNRRRNASRRISPSSSLPSICVTSVHSCNIGSIYAIIKSLGGFRMVPDVDSNTTHVVCGSERRTINVLIGISRGCWILDVSWLYESVEMLKWAPEEPFELFNFCPGAQMSRLSKSEVFKPSLFSEFGRIYVSEFSNPPSFVVQEILGNCGANLCSTKRSADLIIGIEKQDIPITQVSLKWLFDSIQYWEVKNIESYYLNS